MNRHLRGDEGAPVTLNAWPWIFLAWACLFAVLRPAFVAVASPLRLLTGLLVAPLVPIAGGAAAGAVLGAIARPREGAQSGRAA